jgi:hypothetical protein
MSRIHAPTALRLQQLVAADWPADAEEARQVMAELSGFLSDPDIANRDWAAFLLAQSPADGPPVRAALLRAAGDASLQVRGEALLGLARRDRVAALPHVQAALTLDEVSVSLLQAAGLCAHPSLIPDLEDWARPSSNRLADMAATEALLACRLASAHGSAPGERHRSFKFGLQELEDMGNAGLPARAKPPHPRPADQHGAGPQADEAQHIKP